MTNWTQSARERALSVAVAALAVGGVAVVVLGGGAGAPSAAASPADPAAAAHAAAGGVATGPEVAAAFDARVDSLETAVAAAPKDRAGVLALARLLHDGHRIAEAVPLYRRAIALDPTDPTAHYDLAAAHGELGQWTLARDVLRARVAAAPADAIALYDLGVTEANLGAAAAAIATWERARAASPDAELRARIDASLAQLRLAGAPGAPARP